MRIEGTPPAKFVEIIVDHKHCSLIQHYPNDDIEYIAWRSAGKSFGLLRDGDTIVFLNPDGRDADTGTESLSNM